MEKNRTPGGLRAKWAPFPAKITSQPVTEPVSPMFADRIMLPAEPSTLALRSLNKLTENSKKIIASMENNNTILSERIEMLTTEANENQEEINSLYSRISTASSKLESQQSGKYSMAKYMETESFISQLSPNTTEEFLRNKPMILEALLHPGYSDMVADLIKNLPKQSQEIFITYTSRQIHRFSNIWSSFTLLSTSLIKPEFHEYIVDVSKKILESETTFYFLKDINTGLYGCDLPNDITIYLKDLKSLIPQTRKTTIFNHATESPNFNPQVDTVFNPKDRSCIIVPTKDAASIMAIRSDDSAIPFKNEDVAIGDLFSLLNSSLIEIHQRVKGFFDPNDYKKKVDEFERDCLKIDRMETLIPFIDVNFPKLIGADIIKLFFIDDNALIFNVLTEETVLDKKMPFVGVTHHIAKTRRILIENNLDVSICNKQIDQWCIGRSFYGAPIMSSSNECIAVLCAAAPRGKVFTEEQFEAALVIAPAMSLVVQRVTETKSKEHLEAGIKDFTQVPKFMSEMSINRDDIFKSLYKAMNVDSMSVYKQIDNGKIEKMYDFGKSVFNDKFVADQMEKTQLVNTTSPTELPFFECVKGYKYRSVFICFEQRGTTKYGIFCANPNNSSNRLHDNHESIARAFCNFAFNINDEDQLNKDIKLSKQRLLTLEGVVEVCKKHMEMNNITELCRGIGSFCGFEKACFYLYDCTTNTFRANTYNKEFDNIKNTEDIKKILTENKDVFEFKYDMSKKTPFESLIYGHKSAIVNINEEIFFIFIGSDIGDSIYTLNAFLPFIKSHIIYSISSDKIIHNQIEMNKFTRLNHFEDILDYKMQIGQLSKDEMVALAIEILINVGSFDRDFARKFIQKSMKMSKGLWSSCVECLQFSASIISLSDTLFNKQQRRAILIASLFWVLSDSNDTSSASICFLGSEYLVRLERASHVCISCGIDSIDEDFWSMLSQCYTANSEEFYNKIEVFNSTDKNQLNLVGSLITKVSEFRRYFNVFSSEDVTAAVSLTVGEEIVLPLFNKICTRIPNLQAMKESLVNTIQHLT